MLALQNIISASRELPKITSSSPSCRLITQSLSFHNQSQEQRKLRSSEEVQHEKDCRTLGLPDNCQDEGLVRDAYIKLAKRFHPDSGSNEASASKFQEVDTAYRNFLKYFADFRHNSHKIEGEYGLYYKPRPHEQKPKEDDTESPDIKHTAPQHRQYLSFDGVGSGTPREREKQYQKWRAMKAVENVLEHRMEQVSRNSGQEVWELAKEQRAAKKTKTGLGVDRLVEDMIQEAMSRGDFDNLSGKGKPLDARNAYNPYIDFTTHKLNQVLIDNGFAPEWILLEKEIKEEATRIKSQLREIRHIFNETLTDEQTKEWNNYLACIKNDCDRLNKSILKYNLTVPSLHKQVMGFQLEKEAAKIFSKFDPEFHKICVEKANKRQAEKQNQGAGGSFSSQETFLGSLLSIFKI
ncbi:unnamed protein product [Orchesella dallaii]|uniref:J domain-containing protein n=1 Tax=Orchesella dallaii TaxID=48710 RepID=A0ABP1PTN8_9HEXA